MESTIRSAITHVMHIRYTVSEKMLYVHCLVCSCALVAEWGALTPQTIMHYNPALVDPQQVTPIASRNMQLKAAELCVKAVYNRRLKLCVRPLYKAIKHYALYMYI